MHEDMRYVAEHAQAQLWTEQMRRIRAEQQRDAAYALARKLARYIIATRRASAAAPHVCACGAEVAAEAVAWADGQAWRCQGCENE